MFKKIITWSIATLPVALLGVVVADKTVDAYQTAADKGASMRISESNNCTENQKETPHFSGCNSLI